ncbi:class I SAM-dependent methyltransferase [Thermosynechococcus sp. QKsg1]|uniref:class I SAM-dependent methyltransferase n=1 Tax=Thermosynechococcus sp. QKsg1 TaxID=3074130 RepID=UPI0028775939|nr:class I SAM-dependent methyltransferase [Thermosynechococcus sp. QKsg1]WNC87938.1 class I SAM-dependent methyltransferase [Thermosynechococcus sp. QKsg1]
MTNCWFETRKECPACGSAAFQIIYEAEYDRPPIKDYLNDFYSGRVEFDYLEGAVYILCECDVCGMIFQRDIPNKTLMERLYDHWINSKESFKEHQESTGLDYYSCYVKEIMQIISYFNEKPFRLNFLDFGMGWGNWALMAKAFGCEVYGVELSKECIAHAQSNGIKVISWDEIHQYRFDFINTEQVFEHISEPLNTLKYLRMALKPNGMIKVSVPTANDIDRRLKIMDWTSPKGSPNSLNPVAPLEHINFFRRSSLIKMAEVAQMEEVYIPILKQYQYTTGWSGIRNIAKNIILPIYRNVLKKQNYIFLRNVGHKS